MSTIDMAALLAPISPQTPSGEVDLVASGDPDYVALEIKMKGTPERQYDGKTIQEAKDPDWGQVQDAAAKLLTRSHDLRVALFLTRAMLHTKGFQGLETGLALLNGLIERYWDSLYPRLDPEDEFDPTIRNTTLELLSFGEDILGPLKKNALCESPSLGRFNYRDILIAAGKLSPSDTNNTATPTMVDIEAAFKDTDASLLSSKKSTVSTALRHLHAIKATLGKKIGNSGRGPDLNALQQVLQDMDGILEKQMQGRQMHPATDTEDTAQEESTGSGQPAEPAHVPEATTMNAITGRQDVVRLLDSICAYYQRNEPGSPVPLLLKRARQLVDKDFLEIIRDLAPDSAGKIKSLISGVDKEA